MVNTMDRKEVVKEIRKAVLNGKVVDLVYRYLKNPAQRGLRVAHIQPVKWLEGVKGDLQLLAWDVENLGWRRFSLNNVICVVESEIDRIGDMEHELYDIPMTN